MDALNATVTNSNPFCGDMMLVLQEGKPIWKVDLEEDGKYVTLDPKSSLDDFIQVINVAFELIECPSNVKINDNKSMTEWDVIRCIYKTPLEQNVKFVNVGQCGCTVSYNKDPDSQKCSTIVSIEVDKSEYKTYGDVMELLGFLVEDEESGEKYYTYQNDKYLKLGKMAELPKSVRSGWSCFEKEVPVTEKLDPNFSYLSWSYTL
jgi:hypothetical protein